MITELMAVCPSARGDRGDRGSERDEMRGQKV